MASKSFWISLIAAVLGFIGGFLFANALNRSELDSVKAENGRLQKAQNNPAEISLTNEEIKQKIAEADANPGNFASQKNMGLALYRYAAIKRDTDLLSESIRILLRASSSNPKDADIQIGLANAYFDTGYFTNDNQSFVRSREYYRKILAKKPSDSDVRTDLALTYFLQQPPDLGTAVTEFEKSLEANPRHEKTLQFLIQSLVKQNENAKAAKYLEQLKQANPSNPSITELTAMLTPGVPQK